MKIMILIKFYPITLILLTNLKLLVLTVGALGANQKEQTFGHF